MNLALIATFIIILTEYGLQSRTRILAGFDEKWAIRRTILRAILWILAYIAIFRGSTVIIAVLGFVISELTVVVLRRRVRIAIGNGLPHGHPATHLFPFIGGIVLLALVQVLIAVGGFRISNDMLIGRLGLLVLFSVTALWGWGTLVTVSVIELVRPGELQNGSEGVGAGEVIGVLERLATFVLIAVGAFTAVGFVVAAKAAARFPLFKEKAFAEYFLIGTLTSVGVAVLLGMLVQMVR